MTALRNAALQLLGAAEHTLQNPELDTWDSQRWAQEIVNRLAPVVGDSSPTQGHTESSGTPGEDQSDLLICTAGR